MKSGKGEGDGYRKEKKYGSGYMYFSYICNLCFSFFMLPERKIITVRERTARLCLRSSGKAGPLEIWEFNTSSRIFCQSVIFIAETVILPGFWIILSISLVHQKVRLND